MANMATAAWPDAGRAWPVGQCRAHRQHRRCAVSTVKPSALLAVHLARATPCTIYSTIAYSRGAHDA
jgi:hypothetical protein